MKVLITGVDGFIGNFLADYYISKNHEVLGLSKSLVKHNKYLVKECDVLDAEKVKYYLKKFNPDLVYHLAAQSWPGLSWEKPNLTMKVNVEGLVNLFEGLKQLKINPLVIVPCSAAEYGYAVNNEKIKEDNALLPANLYGVSKVVQDFLAYQYYKNFSLKNIRVRIFNATGPTRIGDVCSDFTKRAVMIEKGLMEPVMKVGNLDSKRAFTDVRDIVKAFVNLVEKGKPGEVYNICGEDVYSVKEILMKILKIVNINPEIKQDPNLMRPSDESILFGDISKINNDTGWKPEISIDDTLKDMVEFWRQRL